jgi:hypothetical protein
MRMRTGFSGHAGVAAMPAAGIHARERPSAAMRLTLRFMKLLVVVVTREHISAENRDQTDA